MEGYERYVGAVLDNRYRIDKIIGMGGMAVVFRGEDLLMRRTVAIKILKDDVARDEASVKRFINESKAVSILSHPNIVSIYDVSVRADAKYIVMEYLEGITLKNYITKKGKLDLSELLQYVEQVLLALEHAHQKGIVHRDIKPQNIMLLKNGIIKVTDFGIAKLPNAETVTMKDSAIGTVYYISPEQASGKKIDARSDIYSLGVMMYEMATGKLPFTADSPVSVALKQINDTAPTAKDQEPSVPLGLSQIIARAMDKSPDMRYQSAQQMLRHVTKLGDDPKVTFKPPKSPQRRGKYRMSKGMLPIILGVTGAMLIVAIIVAAVLINSFLNKGSEKNKTITVDEFSGKIFNEELQDYFDKSETYHLKLNRVYDAESPVGYIISQDPAKDEKKKIEPGKTKCEITLTVSLGPQTMKMIDVTSLDYRDAIIKLREMGLRVSTEKISSNLYEVGHIISTAPVADEIIKVGDSVTIYVSDGATGEKIKVPDFKGRTESEVLSMAIDAGFYIGKVTYENSSKVEKGLVISQSIPQGSDANRNSLIDFTVSLGVPETEEVTTEVTTDTQVITETDTEEITTHVTEPVSTDTAEISTDTDDAVYAGKEDDGK